MNTFDLGPIRPTCEYASLLLRITKGCHWNRCKFCNQYKGHKFAMRPLEELLAEIDTVAVYRDRLRRHQLPDGDYDLEKVRADYRSLSTDAERQCFNHVFNWLRYAEYTVFLQDGDALTLRPEKLLAILEHIHKVLPEATNITIYGRPDTICRKSAEDLRRLHEAGITRVYSGFESGHDEVLKNINKGITQAQEIEAGLKVRESGMELSIFLMMGVGGKALSEANAIQTAYVVNTLDPVHVRMRTAVVQEDTPLWADKEAGIFDECTDMEQLWEMRQFVANIKGCTGTLYSDHMINLMQEVEGSLKDPAPLVALYDEFFALDRREQKKYQFAKRIGFNGTWKQMHLLGAEDMARIEKIADTVPDGPKWEELLKSCLRNYI